ncbi:hypothetical protein AEAC466_12705 [Asticcacaulis sp. AC466]|nr:hypothetical protein AEAC466_12705 [Asticcacaulis sp. AC466]
MILNRAISAGEFDGESDGGGIFMDIVTNSLRNAAALSLC